MNVSQFCGQCAASCARRLPQAKGFDFTVFLPLVIEYLIESLSGCGRSDDDIVAEVAKGGFWVDYSVRTAVKKAARADGAIIAGSLRTVSDAIVREAQVAGAENVKAMLQETRSNVPDFGSVWDSGTAEPVC